MFPNHLNTPHLRDFPYQPVSAPAAGPLSPGMCELTFRQQPHEALVTLQGKEKVRKPVDPPPILELQVENRADPQLQFLQNPYLFVCACLYKPDKDEPYDVSTDKSLAGTLVSSLHRLKDVSNKDGGFFVFGDISIKVQGTFRLCFSLYEFQQDTFTVQHLGHAISDKFKVLPAKDFKGLEESTYLSRAFSDQGVRLRLRKEPRSTLHKRSYPVDQTPVSNAPLRPNVEYPPAKKSRNEYSVPLNTAVSSTDSLTYTSSPPNNISYNYGTTSNLYHQPAYPTTHGNLSNSLTHHTGYTTMYPNYVQRSLTSSTVDHSTFAPQYPSSDSHYIE